MKNWDLIERDLYAVYKKIYIEYVSLYADEPMCGLSWLEAETLINKTEFSKKTHYNNSIKLLLKIHCLGYSDLDIEKGLKKLNRELSGELIRKIRERALKRIVEKFGSDIGLITLLYETFKDKNVVDLVK